jgi:hypothetical protein
LLGRAAEEREVQDLIDRVEQGKPAAFWIASTSEYARADRRRVRTTGQRAASLLVDLMERPPASPTEVEVVAASLAVAGQEAAAVRALVHSPKSLLSSLEADEGAPAWWKEELFRFLLRAPNAGETEEIPRILQGLPKAERRKWFLMALASLPEYREY